MTAEELALTIYRPINMTCNEFAIKLAVEFAKIKVTEALKTASEKAEIKIKDYYNESYSLQPTYVTFSQSKSLKEKGFNIITKASFFKNKLYERMTCDNDNPNDQPFISAPEQWQVVEWLRVEKDIWIEVLEEKSLYIFQIKKIGKEGFIAGKFENSPQEAYSKAFDYVLNHLL